MVIFNFPPHPSGESFALARGCYTLPKPPEAQHALKYFGRNALSQMLRAGKSEKV